MVDNLMKLVERNSNEKSSSNILHHRHQQKHLTVKNKPFVICLLINIFQQSGIKSNIKATKKQTKPHTFNERYFVGARTICKRNLLMNSRWAKARKRWKNVCLLTCFEFRDFEWRFNDFKDPRRRMWTVARCEN